MLRRNCSSESIARLCTDSMVPSMVAQLRVLQPRSTSQMNDLDSFTLILSHSIKLCQTCSMKSTNIFSKISMATSYGKAHY